MNIIKIALFEIKIMRRNNIFWLIFILSALLLFLMDSFNYFTIEEQHKMIKDFSLGIMNIISLFVVIYYPVSMIKDEFMLRTIYPLLSTPVNRSTIIIGKALSIGIILFILLAVNTLSLYIILFLKGSSLDLNIFYAVVLIFLKNLIITGFTFLFSVTSLSSLFCVFLSFFVYCLGSIKIYFTGAFEESIPIHARLIQKIVFSIVPNISIYDVVERLSLGDSIQYNHILNCFLHFLGVSILVYGICIFIFNKKEI
ncbi:MAG: hypothetical protein ACD_79C01064G0003 [uncultured bacterium]|nr:MAG: hypothetical protein ACD_79C01064G0003 [uncultured bacterium]